MWCGYSSALSNFFATGRSSFSAQVSIASTKVLFVVVRCGVCRSGAPVQ